MPYKEGRLQVRDLARQNLAMGAKILWNLVSGRESWSKKVLRRKYFPGKRLRCLDSPTLCKKGSPIYKLCLKVLHLFQVNLHWIPGNGKKIKLWEDSIMEDQPLGQNSGWRNIKAWAKDNNIGTLWDISSWEEEGDCIWKDWHFDNLPHWLNDEEDCLIQLLQGKTPTAKHSKDKRVWGQR